MWKKNGAKIIALIVVAFALFFSFHWQEEPSPTPPSPEGSSPVVAVPEKEEAPVDTPEVDTLEVDTPEVDEPEVDEPEVDEPEADEPEVYIPDEGSPKVEKPPVDVPEIDTPKEEKPQPVLPMEAGGEITKELHTATLSVVCSNALSYELGEEKRTLLPEDGMIYPCQQVSFYEGESVFHVLLREMQKNKIHFEYESTPLYGASYIEGISNLYEFDCGDGSGWLYSVNGWFPNFGVNRYGLQEGDAILLVYSCDFGQDVGAGVVVQRDEE